MQPSNGPKIITASLICTACFQQSFNQLSISDSQVGDSMQATTGTNTTGRITSGGISQSSGASESTALSVASEFGTSMLVGGTSGSATGLTTQDASSSGTSTPIDTDATSAETTTGEEAECLLLEGKCHDWNEVRLVFVTSESFTGATLNNADLLCANAAKNAMLRNAEEYRAWITVNKTPPLIRFAEIGFKGPYVKLNPNDNPDLQNDAVVLVANGWKELTTENLLSPINVTEKGETLEGYAWTAVTHDGSTNGLLADCNKWSNSNMAMQEKIIECEEGKNDYGTVGFVGATTSSWSDAQWLKCWSKIDCCSGFERITSEIPECDSMHHIYCFRDRKTE